MFDVAVLQAGIETTEMEARREGVTLFGAGGFARAVRSALEVLGVHVHAYIVTTPTRVRLDGIPVVALEELDTKLKDLPVWLGVFNRNEGSDLTSIANACRSNGIRQVRLPVEYFELIAPQMGWRFWLTDRRNYEACLTDFAAARSLLADDQSREHFDRTLAFRLGQVGATSPAPSSEPQYFIPHVIRALQARNDSVVFVDAGAYDGDTLRQAASYSRIGRAAAFEPDAANFELLASAARSLGFPVTCFPCGLSNSTESLAFTDESGEGSAINPGGSSRIQCVRLDESVVGERIDLLKLDVEGHELAALRGI